MCSALAERGRVVAREHWKIAGVGGTKRDIFELYFIEGFEPDEIAMYVPDEIFCGAGVFFALDSRALCRLDQLAY